MSRFAFFAVVSVFVFFLSSESLANTLRFDVSGASGSSGGSGRDGRDGSSGGWGSFWSNDGDDGEEGEWGQDGRPGADGGEIRLNLSYADPEKTQILIQGEILKPGQVSAPVRQIVPVNQISSLSLRADGGSGGPGGDGGDGGDGGRGGSGPAGRDGCPPSSGSSGGRGGDGGRGGEGGAAGPGGRGGRIVITVPEDQSEILLLVQASASGGSAGQPGDGGRAGSAGSGGWGGSGGRSTCPEQMSDASSGMWGSSGRSGNPGRDGRSAERGSEGQVDFITLGAAQGATRFSRGFDVVIPSLDWVDENEDGVIEPGELVFVRGVLLKNSSAMPSPLDQAIRLELLASEAFELLQAPVETAIWRLAPGESREARFDESPWVLRAKEGVGLGIKALDFSVGINRIQVARRVQESVTVQEAVTLKWVNASTRLYFNEPQEADLLIRNHTQKVVGGGSRPLSLLLSASAKSVEVFVSGPDFEARLLAPDFKWIVPAIEPGAELRLRLKISGKGDSLEVKDQLVARLGILRTSGAAERNLPPVSQQLIFAKDLRPLVVNVSLDLRRLGIQCQFPQARVRENWSLAYVSLVKAAGKDEVFIQYWIGNLISRTISPTHRSLLHPLVKFSELFDGKDLSAEQVVALMNEVVKPLSLQQKPVWALSGCSL